MEAAIARTGGKKEIWHPVEHGRRVRGQRNGRDRRWGRRHGWRAAMSRDGRAMQVLWGALAVGLAMASAGGCVHSYPPAITMPPAIGGKNVPHQIVQQRQFVADQLYAMERRAVRAANRLDRVAPQDPLPASTGQDLRSLVGRFTATRYAMDAAIRSRIAQALGRVRKAAEGGKPVEVREALRKLQVKLAVARYTR